MALTSRVERLQREVGLKGQYLEEKEAFWAAELDHAETRHSAQEAMLTQLRCQLAQCQVDQSEGARLKLREDQVIILRV
jgi:hypothetical protein